MCKTPKAPPITQPAAPLEAPQGMALPESTRGMSVSQLRIGTKNNLKMQASGGAAPSGLTIGKPV